MEFLKTHNKVTTKDLVETALLIALVFVATAFIHFQLPIPAIGGLVHLGTAMLFTVAIVFGGKKGAIAGAVGMAIFDVSSGWALYAPCTFVVKGLMAFIAGSIANENNRNGNDVRFNILGTFLGSVFMIAGYYLYEIFLTHSLIAPAASIPGNILQTLVGIIVAVPLATVLKKSLSR